MNKLLADISVNIVDPNSQFFNLVDYKPSNLVATGINLLLGASGVVAFFYLLWGGYNYITASGDKDGTEKARKRITGALIGLALVFSSYALIYIIQILFNIDIIGFSLQRLNVGGIQAPSGPSILPLPTPCSVGPC